MKKLPTGALVSTLLSFCLFLPFTTSQAQEIKGDALAGGQKNALCIGCHGINGYHTGFPEVYHVPKLSGQGAGYIMSALGEYRSGARKHPSMRTVASSLKAQDIADLAAYYASTGASVTAPATKPADAGNGPALVEKGGCQGCHGADLAKPIDPSYPIIAGQHPDYLYAALRAYKTDKKPQIGRAHPIMSAMVQQFSNDDLQQIADYVSSLPSPLVTRQPPRIR